MRSFFHELEQQPDQQNRALFHDVMKALVIRASEHGIDLLAELNGVRGGDVRIERLLGFPDFHDHMMIEARDLLVDLDAHAALFLAAVGNVLLQQFCRQAYSAPGGRRASRRKSCRASPVPGQAPARQGRRRPEPAKPTREATAIA